MYYSIAVPQLYDGTAIRYDILYALKAPSADRTKAAAHAKGDTLPVPNHEVKTEPTKRKSLQTYTSTLLWSIIG